MVGNRSRTSGNGHTWGFDSSTLRHDDSIKEKPFVGGQHNMPRGGQHGLPGDGQFVTGSGVPPESPMVMRPGLTALSPAVLRVIRRCYARLRLARRSVTCRTRSVRYEAGDGAPLGLTMPRCSANPTTRGARAGATKIRTPKSLCW